MIKIPIVFKSTLRLELSHTPFQIESFHLGICFFPQKTLCTVPTMGGGRAVTTGILSLPLPMCEASALWVRRQKGQLGPQCSWFDDPGLEHPSNEWEMLRRKKPWSLDWTHQEFSLFPGGANGKEPACQSRRLKRRGFDPYVRKVSWRRKWHPTPVFLPGESHEQRSLVSYSPWRHKGLGMTEATWHTFVEFGSMRNAGSLLLPVPCTPCLGTEGRGSPLLGHSCPEWMKGVGGQGGWAGGQGCDSDATDSQCLSKLQ